MIAILLAAGFSRRFGDANKLMHPLADGRAMALAAAQNLVAAIPNTFVMIRPENIALAALLTDAGLQVLTCAEPSKVWLKVCLWRLDWLRRFQNLLSDF